MSVEELRWMGIFVTEPLPDDSEVEYLTDDSVGELTFED